MTDKLKQVCNKCNGRLCENCNWTGWDKKIKIGVDIDDVLCEFFAGYLNFAKDIIGIQDVSNIHNGHLWEVFPITREQAFEIANDYSYSEGFSDIELVDGAKEGFEEISKNNDIIFVTARPQHMEHITRNFLKKHFVEDPIVFHSGNLHGGNRYKHEICLSENVDIMIEDCPRNSLSIANAGIKVALLDKPWNQGFIHPNVTRYKNWKELAKEIK